MESSVYQIISIIGFTLAGLFLAASIIIFIRLKIPAVIGDLSGRTAKKQIQKIREQTQQTKTQKHNPVAFHLEQSSGSSTGRTAAGKSKRMAKLPKTSGRTPQTVGKLSYYEDSAPEPTDVLEDREPTTLLNIEKTTVLRSSKHRPEGTTVLEGTEYRGNQEFIIKKNVIIVHTDVEIN